MKYWSPKSKLHQIKKEILKNSLLFILPQSPLKDSPPFKD